jgi:hypothetical protein
MKKTHYADDTKLLTDHDPSTWLPVGEGQMNYPLFTLLEVAFHE